MKQSFCLYEYIRYTALNVSGMFGLSCYILADTFFGAKGLGANGLAALNLAIPIYSFIHGSGLMLGMGGATRYTILRNQKKEKEGNLAFTYTILLAAVLAVLFCMTGILLAEKITFLLGADTDIFEMSKIYLKVLLLFSPGFLLNDILICFVRNDGAPQLSMLAMVTGSFSNIILDYIFIFPFHMGIFGAVLATGTAPVISLIILSPFFFKKQNQFHLCKNIKQMEYRKQSFRMCRYILTGGVPSLVTELSSGIVMIVFNMLILGLRGNVGVAAYGVVANLSLVVVALYTGVAQGIQPLISKYYGLGQKDHIRILFKYAVITVLLMSAVIYSFFFCKADFIAALFNSERNPELGKMAAEGIKLYFSACVFAGWNIILSIYFTSTDHAGPANIISLLRGFVVIIPMTFMLAYIGNMTGLWFAFPATELAVAFVGVIWYVVSKNQREKSKIE